MEFRSVRTQTEEGVEDVILFEIEFRSVRTQTEEG
jgi:hypothetical protein